MAGYLSYPSLLGINNPCLSQYVSPGDNTISSPLEMDVSCTYSAFGIALDNNCCGAFSIIPPHRWQVPRMLNHRTVPRGNYTAGVNLLDGSASWIIFLHACMRTYSRR